MSDPIRSALAELVRLHDIFHRTENADRWSSELERLWKEYQTKKEPAWEAARAALSSPVSGVGEPVAQYCDDDGWHDTDRIDLMRAAGWETRVLYTRPVEQEPVTQVCCQKWDTCTERCWPLIGHLRAQLASAPADVRDARRLDWLEGEMDREQADLLKFGRTSRHSLFRRNQPITRATIDAEMGAALTASSGEAR